MDTDFSIHHIDAPEATVPVQPTRATESVTSSQFVQRSSANGLRSNAPQSFAQQSGRAGLRAFEAKTEYNPILHTNSHSNAQQANNTSSTTRAERNINAVLMAGQTLAQQQSAQTPEPLSYTARRYSDIVKASEAAAVAALKTSPDGDRDRGQQQNEAEEQSYAPPTVSLASSIAKKEWMRCVSGTPRPMRPTTPLPKLG